MATYDVDIELALKGADKLRELQGKLKAVTKEVTQLNRATVDFNKSLGENFSKRNIGNVNNYSNAVKRAERALRNAAAGTTAEKNAVSALVTAQKEYNAQLDRQNALLREEERVQGVLKIQASDRVSARSSIASPVFGARHIEGSPMARDFGFLPKSKGKGGGTSTGTGTKVTGIDRFGAAVSAGAFPLLFGGGPGMAFGGAAGGAISGSTFGPAAIALQVVGGAVDTFVTQLTSLADGLESTQGILSGLEEAGYRVSDATKSVISSYEDAGLFADAYALALEEINRVLGPDGAAKLAAYNEETKKLQSEIEKVTASLQSEMLPVFTGLIRIILGVKSAFDKFADSPLGKLFLESGKRVATTLVPAIGATETILQGLQAVGAPTGEPGIPESVRLAQEDADMASGKAAIEAAQAAREQIYLVDAQNTLAQVGNNLLDARVVTARKNVIQEEYLEKMRKEGITDDEKTLAGREKQLALTRLGKEIEAAKLRHQEKQTRELERQNKEAEALARKKERAIEKEIRAVERQLERADRAFNRANDQLDKIIEKNQDKLAFEREYSELIRSGSTPAAAKQAVELQKQLLALDRQYEQQQLLLEEELISAELAIAKLKATEATTKQIQEQQDILDGIKKKIEGLPGKKEDAEGAIAAALAPKSDRQRLLDYMTELQGQINDMMDPVRQLTALADTLGSAFGESFKGLVSGSMTAREALANLFQRTADHFLDMAAQMIAAQVKMQILNIGLSFFGGGGGSTASQGLNISGVQQYVNQPFNAGDFTNAFTPKALGGAVGAGQPYLVGEKGPELFVPGAQGNIVPNNAMGGSNIVVNVDASGSSVEGDAQQSKALGQAIGAAVQAEIVKQKMPGGLLN